MAQPMPAIFFRHGNPMNALAHNAWTDSWNAIGKGLPRPRAVLCVSAHWYLPASLVTASNAPRTIYDFGGFPPTLYEVKYTAPGDPQLAPAVRYADGALVAGGGGDQREDLRRRGREELTVAWNQVYVP